MILRVFFLIIVLISKVYCGNLDLYNNHLPFERNQLNAIYKLDNGNFIYIQSFERGDRIWERKINSNNLIEVSFFMSFIALAKNCEMIEENNIFFAQNREYWFAGGTNIDNATIRIFKINDPSPWRDSDLGIAPDINYAKSWCSFYDPLYYRN